MPACSQSALTDSGSTYPATSAFSSTAASSGITSTTLDQPENEPIATSSTGTGTTPPASSPTEPRRCEALSKSMPASLDQVGDLTAMVGDSITVSADNELRTLLPGIAISAYRARTIATALNTDDAVSVLQEEVAFLSGRPLRVVALGTNDVWGLQLSRHQMKHDVRALLAVLSADGIENHAVLWVLPAMVEPIDRQTQNERVWISDLIRRELETLPCAAVIDWPTAVAESDGSWLRSDGVHLTELGRIEFAQTIVTALRQLVAEGAEIGSVP